MFQERIPLKTISNIGNYLETKTEGKTKITENIHVDYG